MSLTFSGAYFRCSTVAVESTRQALAELRTRREQLVRDIAALKARPAPWPEVCAEMAANAVSSCAREYAPTLFGVMRQQNPDLRARGGYDDLPFLDPDRMQKFDGASAQALCHFFPAVLTDGLRELLLKHPPPHPAAECISGADRAAKRSELDSQLKTCDAEIAQLQPPADRASYAFLPDRAPRR